MGLVDIGGGGIIRWPTAAQVDTAREWGRVAGRGITHAAVAEGYGARDERQNMVLVFTPLLVHAWAAATGRAMGRAQVARLDDVLPVEWSVWVPRRHVTVTGRAQPWQVEMAYRPGIGQSHGPGLVRPVRVAVERMPMPLWAKWGPERPMQVTAYFRYADIVLDETARLVLGRDPEAGGGLEFVADFGRLS